MKKEIILSTIQEVLFDLIDAEEILTFRRGVEKPGEFNNASEWVAEQKRKLQEIEARVSELFESEET